MKPELRFDFDADMQNGLLAIRRDFAAGQQLVWDCYTKSELLDQWFAPKPLVTKTVSFEFREGGHWHFAMIDQNDTHYWSLIEYQEISPIDRYTAYDAFTDETGVPNPDMPRSHQIITFSERANVTTVDMSITYESPDDLQKVINMGMREGLASTLKRLDELLARL